MFGKSKKKKDSIFLAGVTIAVHEALVGVAKELNLDGLKLQESFQKNFAVAMSNHEELHQKAEGFLEAEKDLTDWENE